MRVITGRVVSNKMDKTVVVSVERVATHPLYKKQYKTTQRFKAHDAENQCRLEDLVEITETRPLSHDKHFTVSRVLSPAGGKS